MKTQHKLNAIQLWITQEHSQEPLRAAESSSEAQIADSTENQSENRPFLLKGCIFLKHVCTSSPLLTPPPVANVKGGTINVRTCRN